jgi:acetylornithine deacetylase/succinyl-diaminopimelate desuccinylase-like protein
MMILAPAVMALIYFACFALGLGPVRGHRSSSNIVAVAEGVQAHSSTGRGRNANWALIPFLIDMRAIEERLRSDPAFRDDAYDPPFSDFNLIIDNHGTAVNVTAAKATARIKFRSSHSVPPGPILEQVRAAADRAGDAQSEGAAGRRKAGEEKEGREGAEGEGEGEEICREKEEVGCREEEGREAGCEEKEEVNPLAAGERIADDYFWEKVSMRRFSRTMS